MKNILTDAEIQALIDENNGIINTKFEFDSEPNNRSKCTHIDKDGVSVVEQYNCLNASNSTVCCLICGRVWDNEIISTERVENLVYEINSQIEIIKSIGDLDEPTVKTLAGLSGLLKQYIGLHDKVIRDYTFKSNKITDSDLM